ncbi:uncharacterized protein FYW49_007214 [Xenentodon cancila]
MIKLPIPPLPITAYTAKTTKKKKSSDDSRALRRELNRARDRSRINIGVAFPRWRELREDRKMKSDAEFAEFLLDRVPSMEVVVGIEEDNSSQITDSDTEQADNEMGSPAEMSEDVPEEEEASEENSYHDDSNDEDYEPPFYIQFDGTYKTSKCLNPVQSTSKEDSTHDAAEAVEQPAVVDEIQNPTESSSTVRLKKRYICHTCGKEFLRNHTLKRHLVIHLGERPYKCFICGKGFTQGGNLKTHMKTHTGELHKWTLVEEKKKVEEPPVTAHICGECGMDFPEKQQLDEHRETHKKPFECLVCGKTFKWGVSLEIHQRLHSEDTPYRCSVCGKICSTAQTLQKHEAIHTGKKNFHCDQCGKSFLHENYLKIHLKTHTGERPHLCSICGKSYARAGSLRDHFRVHTGERPYTCGKCGKGFRCSQTFQQHRLIHDKKPKPPTRPLGRPKQQVLEGND